MRCPASSSRAGRVGRPLILAGGSHVASSTRVLACGPRGLPAQAWVVDRGGTSRLLLLAGHGPTATIAVVEDRFDSPAISDVELVYAPDGRLLLVWAEPGRIRAQTVGGAPVTVGPASDLSQIAAETAADGRTVVAWTTQDAGLERGEPHVIRAAFRSRGGIFGRWQDVDAHADVDPEQGTGDPRAAIRLAVAPNGRALLQWGTVRDLGYTTRYPLRYALAGPHGRFGRFRQLASDGFPGDVAIRSDGSTLAAWRADGAVQVAYRRFGHPKAFAQGDATDNVAAAFLADGRPTVSWQDPGGYRTVTRR